MEVVNEDTRREASLQRGEQHGDPRLLGAGVHVGGGDVDAAGGAADGPHVDDYASGHRGLASDGVSVAAGCDREGPLGEVVGAEEGGDVVWRRRGEHRRGGGVGEAAVIRGVKGGRVGSTWSSSLMSRGSEDDACAAANHERRLIVSTRKNRGIIFFGQLPLD